MLKSGFSLLIIEISNRCKMISDIIEKYLYETITNTNGARKQISKNIRNNKKVGFAKLKPA